MTREQIIAKLQDQRALFDAEQVRSVALFGSRARGDARADSDVDLLVEYRPSAKVSLLDICRLERLLTDEFGLEVQVVTAPLTRESLRKSVERDRLDVF
jgi:predicted nucleotidyltransferase